MDAAEMLRRWRRAVRRLRERRPEDVAWRARVSAALADYLVCAQEIEGVKVADRKNYFGPFSVVLRIDGQDHERVIGSGLDWTAARDVADLWGDRPHVGQVSIRDEPTQHTVEIVHDRDRPKEAESGEQSSGDSTPVG